jgi:hypothetical protein
MKRTTILFAILLCGVVSAYSQASEKDAVRVPLENYIKGHKTGDPEFMKKAFHTEGNLIFIRDGKYATRSFAEYIGGMSGKPAADEAKRKRAIEMVEVTGDAAIAKVTLDYPAVYFVDYFALLKIDGVWKIVNKSFHAHQRADVDKLGAAVTQEEKKAIAIPLQAYLKAGETADGQLFRQAFRPDAKIMSITKGKLDQRSAEEYAKVYNGEPDNERPRTSFEIIDASGTAAIAKVIIDLPVVKFTDYMTLLKEDGQWRIVNKSSYAEPKRQLKRAAANNQK